MLTKEVILEVGCKGFSTGAQVQVPATLLQMPHPTDTPGKTVERHSVPCILLPMCEIQVEARPDQALWPLIPCYQAELETSAC